MSEGNIDIKVGGSSGVYQKVSKVYMDVGTLVMGTYVVAASLPEAAEVLSSSQCEGCLVVVSRLMIPMMESRRSSIETG